MSLSEERRAALRERLRAELPFAVDGSIPLTARAWAVKGIHYIEKESKQPRSRVGFWM